MLDLDPQTIEKQARDVLRIIKEAKKTGTPIVLTINGQASITIEGDHAFGMLFELAKWVESIAVIRQSLKEFEEGKGISLEDIREEFLRENGNAN